MAERVLICVKHILDYPLTLSVLAGLYPAVFMISNNWFIVQKNEMLVLLFLTPLFALLGGILLTVSLPFFCKIIFKIFSIEYDEKLSAKLRMVFVAIYSCWVVFFLLHTVNAKLIKSDTILLLIFVTVNFFAALFTFKSDVKILNVFLLALTIIAALQGFVSYSRLMERLPASDWYTKNKEHNEKISFKTNPNVYFIVLEAYHDAETIKIIYGTDNTPAENQFRKRGFVIYKNMFANYKDTLLSLSATFAMQHHFHEISAGEGDAIGAREIIGGETYNAVLSVFKNNHYQVQYLSYSDYCYFAGSAVDYAYPERTFLKAFAIFQNKQLDQAISLFFKNNKDTSVEKDIINVSYQNADEEMLKRIEVAAHGQKPYFTFFKSQLPGHFIERWDEIYKDCLHYPQRLAEATAQSLNFVDLIIEKDPNALIIVLGDHGALRYRGICRKWDAFHSNLEKCRITENVVARDVFATFLAIKWPKGTNSQFNINSHVNLFRYIFSSLSKSDYPLKTRVKDESYFNNTILVRDGMPLDHWEPFREH